MQPQAGDSANSEGPKVINPAQSVSVGSQAVQATTGQPVVEEAPKTASSHRGSKSDYVSNPFIVGFRNLSKTMNHNPVPMVLTTAIGIGAVIAFYFFFGLVGGVLPIVSLVLSIPISIGLMLGFVLLYTMSVVTAVESEKGSNHTTKQVYELSKGKLVSMAILLIALAIIVFAGFLLFIIPGVILAIRLALAPLILIAENATPTEAINRSMKLTKGHFWEVFSSTFAASLYSYYGLLMYYIPISFTAGRYYDLKKLEDTGAPKPPVHKLNYVFPASIVVLILLFIGLFAMLPSATEPQYDLENNTRTFEDDTPFDYDSETFSEDETILVPDASEL